jgi:acyl-CoA dehydrogenase
MDFYHSANALELQRRLSAFMDANIYPNEQVHADEIARGDRWQPLSLIEDLKQKAKAEGLWNLFFRRYRAFPTSSTPRLRR